MPNLPGTMVERAALFSDEHGFDTAHEGIPREVKSYSDAGGHTLTMALRVIVLYLLLPIVAGGIAGGLCGGPILNRTKTSTVRQSLLRGIAVAAAAFVIFSLLFALPLPFVDRGWSLRQSGGLLLLTSTLGILLEAGFPELHYSELYNGMITPLMPFNFRGALWYQGRATRYTRSDIGRFCLPSLKVGEKLRTRHSHS